jgi:hypothetical protein
MTRSYNRDLRVCSKSSLGLPRRHSLWTARYVFLYWQLLLLKIIILLELLTYTFFTTYNVIFIQLFDKFLKTSFFTHEICELLVNTQICFVFLQVRHYLIYIHFLGKRRSFVFLEKLNFIKKEPSSLYHVPK